MFVHLSLNFSTNERTNLAIYIDVDTGGSANTLPRLWVFLLIVLGLLLAIIGTASWVMHYMQRRRRTDLRNRIAAGQVDLENLGIKRLNVPQEIIDKLPLLVYVSDESDDHEYAKTEPAPNAKTQGVPLRSSALLRDDEPSLPDSLVSSKGANIEGQNQSGLPLASTLPHRTLPFSQPSCSICLEDFVSHQTIVRSLPCSHAYHPGCIGPLLREYSSLCPVCKGRVLPLG